MNKELDIKYKPMNAKAAICKALLRGDVLSIKSAFYLFGTTNLPREISRQIEKPFGVTISRTQKEGKTKYGVPCTWYEYRLNKTDYNKEGIEKMRKYVQEHESGNPPKTEQQLKQLLLIQ